MIALLDPSDAKRDSCLRELEQMAGGDLVTTEAVITETSYMLEFSRSAQIGLQDFVHSGRIRVEAIARTERARIMALMQKYSDLPMDYADATLVLLAERMQCNRVFTLDRRDFGAYRLGKRRFELLPQR
ncbi:MAG: PIN domain-containing protein [Deltaproteobacteria bacterium]|nr:PIN domain-containing protein [Deltaproteobacteria bacterium]